MSLAFQGTETFHFNLGVVNADHGPVASRPRPGARAAGAAPGRSPSVPIATTTAASDAVRANAVQAGARHPGRVLASVDGRSARGAHRRSRASTTRLAAKSRRASPPRSWPRSTPTASRSRPRSRPARHARDTRSSAAAADAPDPRGRRCSARSAHASSRRSATTARRWRSSSCSSPSASRPASFFVDRGEGMIERMRAAPVRPAADPRRQGALGVRLRRREPRRPCRRHLRRLRRRLGQPARRRRARALAMVIVGRLPHRAGDRRSRARSARPRDSRRSSCSGSPCSAATSCSSSPAPAAHAHASRSSRRTAGRMRGFTDLTTGGGLRHGRGAGRSPSSASARWSAAVAASLARGR